MDFSGNEVVRPQLVDYLSGVDTMNIECGADFTFAVSENFVNYQSDYFDPQNDGKLNQRKLHYDSSLSPSLRSLKSKNNSPRRSVEAINGMKQRSRNKMGRMLNRLRRNKGDQHHGLSPRSMQQPQYRQPGLPLKSASERRKHQAEIERIQQTFSKEVTHKLQQRQLLQDDEHKFESLITSVQIHFTLNACFVPEISEKLVFYDFEFEIMAYHVTFL